MKESAPNTTKSWPLKGNHRLDDPKKPSLAIHEWIAVVFLGGMFFIVALFSFVFNGVQQISSVPQGIVCSDHYVEIAIEGAVESPGVYKVKQGTLIKEVLEKAKPLSVASLNKINLEAPLKRSRRVRIPSVRQEISCSSEVAKSN